MPDNIRSEFIDCPYCGAQYLPVEIFVPNAFFGKPVYIERDANHKIIDIVGSHLSPYETYTCIYCNKTFKVTAKTQFISKLVSRVNFDEDYSTPLTKKSLFLKED